MIQVTIKTLDNKNKSISVDDETTVAQLKEVIREQMDISIELQRLIFCGKLLADNAKLADCKVNGKVIHLVPKPPPSLHSRNAPRQDLRQQTEAVESANRLIDRMVNQSGNSNQVPRVSWAYVPPSEAVQEQMFTASLTPVSGRLDFIRQTFDEIRNSIDYLSYYDGIETPANEVAQSDNPAPDGVSGDRAIPEPMETEPSPGPSTSTANNIDRPAEMEVESLPGPSTSGCAKKQDKPAEMDVEDPLPGPSTSASNMNVQPPRGESSNAASIKMRRRPNAGEPSSSRTTQPKSPTDTPQSPRRPLPPRRGPLPPSRTILARPRDLASLLEELGELHELFAPHRAAYVQILRDNNCAQVLNRISNEELARRQAIIELAGDVAHSFAHAYHAISDLELSIGDHASRLTTDPVTDSTNMFPMQHYSVDVMAPPDINQVAPVPQLALLRRANLSPFNPVMTSTPQGSHTVPNGNPTQASTSAETVTFHQVAANVPVRGRLDTSFFQDVMANVQSVFAGPQGQAQGTNQPDPQSQPQNQAQNQSRTPNQNQGQAGQDDANRPRVFMDFENLLRTLSQTHPGMDVVMSMEEVQPLGSPITIGTPDIFPSDPSIDDILNSERLLFDQTTFVPFNVATVNSTQNVGGAQNGANAAAGNENNAAGGIRFGNPGAGGAPRFNIPGVSTAFGVGSDNATVFQPGVGVTAYGPTTLTLQTDGGVFVSPLSPTTNARNDSVQSMLNSFFRASNATINTNSTANAGTTAPSTANSTSVRGNAATSSAYSTPGRTNTAPSSAYSTPGRTNVAPSTAYSNQGRANGTPSTTNAAPSGTNAAPTINLGPNANNIGSPFTIHSHITYRLTPEVITNQSLPNMNDLGTGGGQEIPYVIYPLGMGGERGTTNTGATRRNTHARRRADRENTESPRLRSLASLTNLRAHQRAQDSMVYDRYLTCNNVYAVERLNERRVAYHEQQYEQTRQRHLRPTPISIDRLEQRNYNFTTRHMACMMRLLSGPICLEGRLNAFMVTVARVLYLEPQGRSCIHHPAAMPQEFHFVRLQMRDYISRVVETVVNAAGPGNLFDRTAVIILRHNLDFIQRITMYTVIKPEARPEETLRRWLRCQMPYLISCIMSEYTSDNFVDRFYSTITRFFTQLCGLVMNFCATGFEGFRQLYTAYIEFLSSNFEVTSQEWVRLLSRENLLAIQSAIDPLTPASFVYQRTRLRQATPVATPPPPPARNDTPDTVESLPSMSIPTMSSSSSESDSPLPPEPDDDHSLYSPTTPLSPPADSMAYFGSNTSPSSSRSPLQICSPPYSPQHEDTATSQPEQEVETQEPETETQEPEIETKEPEIEAKEPEIEAKEPEIEAKEPEIEAKEPEIEAKEPVAETQQLETETQKPEIETQEPEIKTQEPETETQKPETKAQEPETKAQEPETETQEPETKSQETDTETQDLKAETQEPEIEIQELETETQEPEEEQIQGMMNDDESSQQQTAWCQGANTEEATPAAENQSTAQNPVASASGTQSLPQIEIESDSLSQFSDSDSQPLEGQAVAEGSDRPAVDVDSPQSVRLHFDEQWLPVLTRDQRLQRERERPQEPFSEAYLMGMPSRKRRRVRAARPPTTFNDFVNESFRAASDQLSDLDTAEIRSRLVDSVRTFVRERVDGSEDYNPVRFSATATFLEQAPTPSTPEEEEPKTSEEPNTSEEKME